MIFARLFRRKQERTLRLRASILAAFVVPEPTSPGDLMDRAISTRDVALWLCGKIRAEDLTAEETEAVAEKAIEVKNECEAMVKDQLLNYPLRLDMDHWKPAPGVYILTTHGAAKAMAVLKAAQEANHGK